MKWWLFLFINVLVIGALRAEGAKINLVEVSAQFSQEQKQQAVEKYALVIISRSSIDCYKKTISQYFVSNKNMRLFVRVAALTAFVAASGVLVHYMLKSHEPPAALPGDVQKLQEGVKALNIKTDEILAQQKQLFGDKLSPAFIPSVDTPVVKKESFSLLNSVTEGVKGFFGGVYDVGKFIVRTTIYNAPAAAIQGVITAFLLSSLRINDDGEDRESSIKKKRKDGFIVAKYKQFVLNPIDRIIHPIDVPWFLNHHIAFNEILNHMRATIQLLPLIDRYDVKEQEHQVACVIADLNALMGQLTKLTAFLEIQSEILVKKSKSAGLHLQRLSIRFFAIVESLPFDIAPLLEKYETFKYIPGALTAFEQRMNELLRQYKLYEKAILLDID